MLPALHLVSWIPIRAHCNRLVSTFRVCELTDKVAFRDFLCLLRAGVRDNEPPSHCWCTTFTSRGERRTLAHRPYYSLSDGQWHCRAEPCVSFDPGYVGRHQGSRILPAPWFKRHSTRAITIIPISFFSKRIKATRELWNTRTQGNCWP